MGWMSWKRETKQIALGLGELDEMIDRPRMDQQAISAALLGRGASREFGESISEQLEPRLAALDPEACDAVLDGVAMAFVMQQEKNHQLARSLKGLREVERMMGAFSGELSKLDEVLEVLSAYVRRMRSSGGSEAADRVLH